MVDKTTATKTLQNLGLSEEEIHVYLELVRQNSLSILELSRKTKIPRTTVYRICEKLVEKKFLEWVVEHNSSKVKAVHPESLGYLVEEKKNELEVIEDSLAKLKTLIAATPANLPKTEVRYYQSAEGLRQMIWNCLKAEKEVLGYSVYGRKEIVGVSFYEKYVSEFNLRKLRDRTVINEEGTNYLKSSYSPAWHQQHLEDIRFLPKRKFYIEGDISIYNDVYALSVWRGHEVVGVEIENVEFVKNQKSIFELLWSIAEPISPSLLKVA